MSPQITVEHPDGSTETIPGTVAPEDGTSYTRTRQLGAMRRARINVYRDEAEAVTLTEKRDLIHLGSIDTLRLVDIETGGPTWTLVCYSLEWDSNREPYTAGGDTREGTDDELITDLVGEVDSWTAGTIESLSRPLSFVFNHAHQHEALRRIEKNVPGEIQFRDEGTVDYLDRLGTDRSGSVELSAAAGTIEDEISITKRGRELDGTHVRVLGAHEGEAQIFANLVPAGDTTAQANLDNVVTYTTTRWSGPADTDWDRWANKDVTDQDTIEEEAESLADEITESLVEATATTNVGDLNVGDTVRVVKADADLDRAMRIHRIKETVRGATETAQLTLSTRTTMRSDDTEDLRDLQRFNTGFQGSSVVIQGGGSRQPVNGSLNAEIPFDYPDIEFENEAQLLVRGLPYRAYSSGAAAGGANDDTTEGGGDHTHQVDINDLTNRNTTYSKVDERRFTDSQITFSSSWSNVDTFTPSVFTSEVWVYPSFTYIEEFQSTQRVEHELLIRGVDDSGNYYPTQNGITVSIPADSGSDSEPYAIGFPGGFNGRALDLQAQVTEPNGSPMIYDFEVSWNAFGVHEHLLDVVKTSDASGPHTHQFSWRHIHDPEPGIIQFGSDTPSNVDVIINGNTVATDIGSGLFETEVDIGGELTVGAWNDIELSSDSLGHIQATVSIDGYKQIGKN
jgi:hypothetical protein